MNNLMQNNIKTMSSRELASLCDKAHDSVLKTIRSLIERGVVLNTIPQTYIHEQNGQRYTEFLSNKRDSFVIVARLSPEFTADVVDRWQELEQQISASSPVMPALPQSFSEALLLAGTLQQKIEQDAPKVAHYNKVVDRHMLLTATQVGQKIGLSAVMLNRVLSEIGVYNKALKRGKAFKQWFIDKDLGEMKQTDMGYSQPLFTLAGEAWVIERLASEGVA